MCEWRVDYSTCSKENHFSFHPDAAGGKKKRVESGDQVGGTWKNQLMQFNNVSEPMASAVVAAYPSPARLISVSSFSPSFSHMISLSLL